MANPVTITAPDDLPVITIQRDFDAPVAAVQRAHEDPDLFARWIGPDRLTTEIDTWDMRTGGEYRYVTAGDDGDRHAFRGCFHEVAPGRIVQTFTYEGFPESVLLETLVLTDLGDGRTRLEVTSLADSFESRDGMVASGMEEGVVDGYDKLDGVLAEG